MTELLGTHVVYGIFDFGDGEGAQLIAAKKADALRRSTNLRVLSTASTWADVKSELDSEDYEKLCRDFRDNYLAPFDGDNSHEIKEPPGNTPFDTSFVKSEYGYETWVVDPLADMTRWVPPEIQDYFGHVGSGGMFCDSQLTLDSKLEAWIVKAFEMNGFDAKRDDELVRTTFEC